MSFFKKLFNKSKQQEWFLGDWVLDKEDIISLQDLGDVKMSFKSDGKLNYEIREKGKSQFILMTYLVEEDKLITDQPSHPHKEKTDFVFVTPTVLILKFNGKAARFIKN